MEACTVGLGSSVWPMLQNSRPSEAPPPPAYNVCARGRGKRVEEMGVKVVAVCGQGRVCFCLYRWVVMRPMGVTPSTMTDLNLHADQRTAS